MIKPTIFYFWDTITRVNKLVEQKTGWGSYYLEGFFNSFTSLHYSTLKNILSDIKRSKLKCSDLKIIKVEKKDFLKFEIIEVFSITEEQLDKYLMLL